LAKGTTLCNDVPHHGSNFTAQQQRLQHLAKQAEMAETAETGAAEAPQGSGRSIFSSSSQQQQHN